MENQTERVNKVEEAPPRTQKEQNARLREIVRVLTKYNVLLCLAQQTNPENVRKAFEELGPTFIKIGQILSVRTDIVSPEFAEEFKKLQAGVKSDDFSVIGPSIEKEAGVPLEDLFKSIEEKPLASASIGQVHTAVLKNGQAVVVKVQHPGIYNQMSLDIALLEKAVPLVKHVHLSGMVDPASVVGELKRSLMNELDFTKEADNIELFYKLNHTAPHIRSPKVYREYSGPRLLIMDFMQGMKVSDFVASADEEIAKGNTALKEVKSRLAKGIVDNYMKQIFDDGYFHADPHPGNLLISVEAPPAETGEAPALQPPAPKAAEGGEGEAAGEEAPALLPALGFDVVVEGQSLSAYFQKQHFMENFADAPPADNGQDGGPNVVYIDFGMMGTLDEHTIDQFNRMLAAITQQDSGKIAQALLGLCKAGVLVDMDAFTSDVDKMFRQYYDMPIGDMNIPVIFEQMGRLCAQYQLKMPQNIVMLIKGIGTIEGIVLSLDPGLSIMTAVEPYAKRYLRRQFSPKEELQDMLKDLYTGLRSIPRLPTKLMNVLDTLSRGEMKVSMQHQNLDDLFLRLEVMVNRLVMGLIVSALIVGSSMLVNYTASSAQTAVSTFGVLGFVLALVLAGVMIFQTGRKQKK